MERKKRRDGRFDLRWWHHAALIGALGVGALYLVEYLYPGMLFYYAGPGDPLWIDEIVLWWHVVFGALLGMGVGVWVPTSLKPPGRGIRVAVRSPSHDLTSRLPLEGANSASVTDAAS